MLSGMRGSKGRNGCILNIVAIGDESMHGMDMSTTVENQKTRRCYLIPLQLPRDIA